MIDDPLAIARAYVRQRAPYWGATLSAARYVPLPGLGTAGITPGGVVAYDPAWAAGLPLPELAGVVVHEVAGHWIRRHHQRQGTRDAQCWNLCCDASINASLRAAGWQLPRGAVYPESLHLPPQGSPEEYYEILTRQQQQQPQQGQQGQGQGQPQQGQQGQQQPQAGQPGQADPQGQSGQPGQGQPQQGQPQQGQPQQGQPQQGQGGQQGQGQGDLTVPGAEELDRHYGQSAAGQARAERATAQAVAQHVAQHGTGSVPAGWATWAGEQLAPPQVPWRQKLARVCRTAVTYRQGAADYSWRRPSRRQGGIGYGPGLPLLPSMHCPVPPVALITDTSGSMGSAEQCAAMAEVSGVLRVLGAPVHVMSCDAAVHDSQRVSAQAELRRMQLHGGGGTDFRPAIQAALQLRPRPEIIIYLTDGYGTYPTAAPPRVRVIWVLIGTHCPPDRVPWGEVVAIDTDTRRTT